MAIILKNIIPDYGPIIKCPTYIAIIANQDTSPIIVMAVIILNDGVFTKIVTIKAAGIYVSAIIYRKTGLIELPEGIIAVIGVRSISCGEFTAFIKVVVLYKGSLSNTDHHPISTNLFESAVSYNYVIAGIPCISFTTACLFTKFTGQIPVFPEGNVKKTGSGTVIETAAVNKHAVKIGWNF